MDTTKHFELVHLNSSVYRFVVFATSGINPISELQEIENELLHLCTKCEILFDLLLSNGDASNRFVSGFFDGIRFRPGTFKIVRSLPKEFRQVASNHFARSKNLFSRSMQEEY